jgi:hypothetical protein
MAFSLLAIANAKMERGLSGRVDVSNPWINTSGSVRLDPTDDRGERPEDSGELALPDRQAITGMH